MILKVILNTLYAFIASLGFGVLFNIKGKNLIFASIGGGLGWLFYLICLNNQFSDTYSLFIASLIVSLFSEIMARSFKAPVTVFIICSILPLVPGGGMYYTMLESVKGNIDKSINLGVHTLINAGSIAVAIVLVSSLFKLITFYKFNKK
ncbi:threonine/serine exporter family protein [Haloimpatiens sp. FM7330]|uniref:threonine/serine exporter family protein n=1 Tax=Haloimpatiens sp. FM7330 TaxID=3298610 RepID=UPI003630C3FD